MLLKIIRGEWVKVARKRAGLAQVDIAAARELEWNLKINQADISEIEWHARMVRAVELKALAAVLNVERGGGRCRLRKHELPSIRRGRLSPCSARQGR